MTRSIVFLFSIALTILLCSFSSRTRANPQTEPAAIQVELEPVLSGLISPIYVTGSRDGSNRLFIVEQGGRIKVLQPGATTPAVFLDISARVLSGGERGLLGLALHPDFRNNRRFFVDYTRQPDGATVIAEESTAWPMVSPKATRILPILKR